MIRTIAIIWMCFPLAVFGQQLSENDELTSAATQKKHVLLVFSGSDWCRPCIRLEKDILNQERFKKAVQDHFVVLRADFPRRKRLKPEVIQRNEKLAERYNPKGEFPKVVLIPPGQSKAVVVDFAHFDIDRFIRDIYNQSRQFTHTTYRRESLLMGTRFSFTLIDSIYSDRAEKLLDQCIEEVIRIESVISEWDSSSDLSALNESAGEPFSTSPELYELIERSQILSRLTQGAFDITFLPLLGLWQFKGEEVVPPDARHLSETLEKVGYERLQLTDPFVVRKGHPGMKMGFGGMGKGYAADRVVAIMKAQGIRDGVVNASGDLVAWGKPPDDTHWKVGIADPRDPSKMICWIPVNDGAVATSGDYEKYLLIGGQRYAHILDPKTGWPVRGITSVTVLSGSAELSDALATAIFVLGIENGLDLIEQLPNAECLIIDASFNLIFSSNLNYINRSE